MVFPALIFLRTDPTPAVLDAAFSAAFADAQAPAVAAAMVKDGHTVWTKASGFADLGKTKPATPDTIFRLASLTKAFTATVVLQLVNEKKLSLDDTIGQRLPELPKAWQGATIRQLLSHTSGIPSYTDLPDFLAKLNEKWTPAQIVARTADKPLDFPSGTKWAYDNTGYVILGMLVEKLDRKPFAQSLSKRIFKPLGMTRTMLDVGDSKGVADATDGKGKPAITINMSQPYAAGSIVSTVNDMAKWLGAQGSEKLLPAGLWKQAWTPVNLADGTSTHYAFGWEAGAENGVPTIEHSGGIPGFHTYVRRVPSLGLSVVVLANSDISDPGMVATKLLEAADPSLKASDAAIADPDPKVTASVETLLKQFAEGKPDRSVLNKDLDDRLTPEIESGMKDLLTSFGAFQEIRLVKLQGPVRTYLVRYEKKTVRVIASVGPDGKFMGFGIRPA
jgi:CubicO group peptidase (beta-lactamase class C family)